MQHQTPGRKIACKNHVHPQYTVQHRYDRFRPHGSAIHGGHGHPSLGPMWGNYGLMTIPRCKNATEKGFGSHPHMKRSNEVIQLRMMIAPSGSYEKNRAWLHLVGYNPGYNWTKPIPTSKWGDSSRFLG